MSSSITAEMPALSAAALETYDRFCAQCGTELEDDQEWCLECGAARTLIHGAPDWRIPVAIVATVVLLVLVGCTVALINLSRDTNAAAVTVTAAAPTPASGAVAAAAPGATSAPDGPTPKPHLGAWPVGLSGWTVVLFTSHSHAKARAMALRLAAGGLGVGVLSSDQHPNLTPGNWVVFHGRYPHDSEATAAAARLRAAGQPNARVRQVARPGGL